MRAMSCVFHIQQWLALGMLLFSVTCLSASSDEVKGKTGYRVTQKVRESGVSLEFTQNSQSVAPKGEESGVSLDFTRAPDPVAPTIVKVPRIPKPSSKHKTRAQGSGVSLDFSHEKKVAAPPKPPAPPPVVEPPKAEEVAAPAPPPILFPIESQPSVANAPAPAATSVASVPILLPGTGCLPCCQNQRAPESIPEPVKVRPASEKEVLAPSNPSSSFGLGINYLFPEIHYQLGLSDHFSIGANLMLLEYPAARAISLKGTGALLNLNYYSEALFQGLWMQVAGGTYSLRLTDGTSDSNFNRIGVIGQIGWRWFWGSGANFGFGVGAHYILGFPKDILNTNFNGFLPSLTMEIGFHL